MSGIDVVVNNRKLALGDSMRGGEKASVVSEKECQSLYFQKILDSPLGCDPEELK